ncbi:MAG TPA: hypothetical protein VE621_00485 [Bryobacteraceae bacterium]|nr:hypothetical protein [Bryobacteraceae bacterium]
MSQATANNGNAVGLDVGTSRIVTARRADDDFRYQTELNAFVSIPYSKMAEQTLRKERVLHSVQSGEIVVQGTESERFADLLGVEMRRTMSRGVLNSDEPESLEQIRQILEAMIGPAKAKGQKLCFSVPAEPVGSTDTVGYHETSIRQILTDLGYNVRSIHEGLAVAYSELEASNYTGIGVSCGGGLCNVSLCYMSVPVLSFSIPRGGDYIDTNAATATGELINRIRITKEDSFHFNGYYADKTLQALNVYYDEVIQSLVAAMRDAFESSKSLPKLKRPIPMVLSGGTVMPRGFRDRFEKAVKESSFPIAVSEIRLAANPLESTAKGALIAAMTED